MRGKGAGLALQLGLEKGELLRLAGLGASGRLHGTMAGRGGFAQCRGEARAGTATMQGCCEAGRAGRLWQALGS